MIGFFRRTGVTWRIRLSIISTKTENAIAKYRQPFGISWWNPSATSENPTSSRKLNARTLTVGRSLTKALIASVDDVVDAEDHFEDGEGDEGDPDLGVEPPFHAGPSGRGRRRPGNGAGVRPAR